MVFQAIPKLYSEYVNAPSSFTSLKILNNSRFYPPFENCIGALDGTHVYGLITIGDQERYMTRKGGLSQTHGRVL